MSGPHCVWSAQSILFSGVNRSMPADLHSAGRRNLMAEYLQDRKAVSVPGLKAMRQNGDKITMLTCYDASFAALMDRHGVEVLLIGDSLGMVCNGHSSTLPVTVEEVAYHTAAVARGSKSALVLA